MTRFFPSALFWVASFTWGQTPAPTPATAPQTPPAAERPPLKLKLDNPSSWATVSPDAAKDQPASLPGLGDNARPMPKTLPSTPNSNSPYPSEPKAGY
jgi:hypothetical protein